ncbi:MAG: hypothetical protein LBG47_01710 [Prevotellaceae bacterium]|jgi:hypothetical protein|nr:hypothetical protein [Prevotellaceae bacterium]
MKKYAFLLATSACLALSSHAQNDEEALRFSRSYPLGTARFSAMGGAFTALGGDLTTLAYNPAGIGVYRTGEFSVTPNLNLTGVTSSYMGNKLADNRYLLGCSNIGGVGVINTGDGGIVSISLGAAYNKLSNFSERLLVRGNPISAGSTYLDYFALVANNDVGRSDIEAEMAFYTDLITFDTINDRCYPNLDDNDKTEGRRSSEAWGSIGEFDISIGGNIEHSLYFGLTIGVQNISYSRTVSDIDEGIESNTSAFEGFTYKREYRMSGMGYNFKAGVIARPFANADFLEGLRLGAAIHTPTFLALSDRYDASISSSFLGNGNLSRRFSNDLYEYNIETPFKFMGGVAYTFGHHESKWRGIVSADCEYVNYTAMKMRNGSDGYDFFNENQDIENSYRSTVNFRFGAELGYDNLAVRAGFATYGNPYESDVKKSGSVNFYSLGVGYRSSVFFADFAYSLAMQEDKSDMYSAYGLASDEISYDILQNNIMLTLGFRF